MTGGWLEHEIRTQPHVLACSITDDDVVVLVQPSADPVLVERSISDLLRARGIERPVRVFGGTRPVFVEPVRIRNGLPALVGSVGGALLLAVGVWLAGSGVGLRTDNAASRSGRTELVLAPPVVREIVGVTGGGEPAPAEGPAAPGEPAPTTPTAPVVRPVVQRPVGQPPAPAPPPVKPPVVPTPPAPEFPTAACVPPHAGVIVPFPGQGNGPPPWSHSIHVEPHCDSGKPK